MSNFTRNMDYTAEFLRGWPVDGGLELDYPIASGVTLSAGDLVKPYYNSGVTYVTPVVLADSNYGTAATAAGIGAGIVVRGNGDDKSCAASGKAIVLWGHYIVRTQKFDTGISAAGVPVAAGHGTSALTSAAADGIFVGITQGTAPVAALGYVLEYTASAGGQPAQIIVVVR